MTLLKVDNIMYRVKDLSKAIQFYENILQLEKVWEDKKRHMVGFRLSKSDSEIVLHDDPTLPVFDWSFLVENVERVCENLKTHGVTVTTPIDVRCGKYAVVSDPDGNKIPIIDLTRFGGRPRYDVLSK